TIRRLTIDCAIEAADGGQLASSSNTGYQFLFGAGFETRPTPIYLKARSDGYLLSFLTHGGVKDSTETPRYALFGDPTKASGIQKISLQIDFTHNTDNSTDNSHTCSI